MEGDCILFTDKFYVSDAAEAEVENYNLPAQLQTFAANGR
jgi:hypothetical protein